jgi:hypothetical protein
LGRDTVKAEAMAHIVLTKEPKTETMVKEEMEIHNKPLNINWLQNFII